MNLDKEYHIRCTEEEKKLVDRKTPELIRWVLKNQKTVWNIKSVMEEMNSD